MSLAVGATLGPHRVVEHIGSGGMGDVYKAEDSRLDRAVALKVLPAAAVRDEVRRQRLIQEARAASSLDKTD
jgi:serine/threonine protein kinase